MGSIHNKSFSLKFFMVVPNFIRFGHSVKESLHMVTFPPIHNSVIYIIYLIRIKGVAYVLAMLVKEQKKLKA